MSEPAVPDRARGTTARTVAPAKVNLFLRILAREASGYHQLETLFCRLELGDEVTLRTNVRGRSLDCAGDVIPAAGLGPIDQNLAWRAAEAYATATGWPNDWAIEVTKHIPVGGGLGGGSADAGAVLRCLNALSARPLSHTALLSLGATLGADVPFLTLEAPLAIAWGRGERLVPLPAVPPRDVTLVCFDFGVSSRDAYSWFDVDHPVTAATASSLSLPELSVWSGIARLAHNDFEHVVASRHAEIANALRLVRAQVGDGTSFALMSGSGSTVAFVSADTAAHARLGDGRLAGLAARLVRTRTAASVVGVEVAD